MRVIAGKYRGLRLSTLKGGNLRPTTDQLRETLFDVSGPQRGGRDVSGRLRGHRCGGHGGLEPRRARRGLYRASPRRFPTDPAEPGGAQDRFRLRAPHLHRDHGPGCRLERENERFDVVFVDPPYEEIREYHHTLRQLARGPLLGPASVVIAEHSKHIQLEENYLTLHRTRLLRHGDAQLAFYRQAP